MQYSGSVRMCGLFLVSFARWYRSWASLMRPYRMGTAQEGLENEGELQSWFLARMNRFLLSKGRKLMGWDEILEGGLVPGSTVMSWRVSNLCMARRALSWHGMLPP